MATHSEYELTRRVLIAAALSLIPAARAVKAGEYDSLRDQSDVFNRHWGRFYKKLLGCPEKATDVSECKDGMAEVDYAEFRKAGKIAKDLFDLKP